MQFVLSQMHLAAIATIAGLVSAQQYSLVENCQGHNFLGCFDFYTGKDPTNGFVNYLGPKDAINNDLIETSENNITIRADSTHVLQTSSQGRSSVRLEARKSYTHAMYILSLDHVPYGCGTWPAFWTLGPSWPAGGEIDIIEGVNVDPVNWATLHTSDNCTVAGVNETGTLLTNDCSSTRSTSGCVVEAKSPESYGAKFNKDGGGIYAVQWTSGFIRIWFFPHQNTPSSIRDGSPNPDFDFGTPMANFQGSCNFDQHFHDHKAIFDLTFCGDWAGNTYGSAGCPMLRANDSMASCKAYIAETPQAFKEAYWKINYLRVFQRKSNKAGATSTSAAPTPPQYTISPVASSHHVTSISNALGKSSTGALSSQLIPGPSSLGPSSAHSNSLSRPSETTQHTLKSSSDSEHLSSSTHHTSTNSHPTPTQHTSSGHSLTSTQHASIQRTTTTGSTSNAPPTFITGSRILPFHTSESNYLSHTRPSLSSNSLLPPLPSVTLAGPQCGRLFAPPALPTNASSHSSTSLKPTTKSTSSSLPSITDAFPHPKFHVYCDATFTFPNGRIISLGASLDDLTAYGSDNLLVACLQRCAALTQQQCAAAVFVNDTTAKPVTGGVVGFQRCQIYGLPQLGGPTGMAAEARDNGTALIGKGGEIDPHSGNGAGNRKRAKRVDGRWIKKRADDAVAGALPSGLPNIAPVAAPNGNFAAVRALSLLDQGVTSSLPNIPLADSLTTPTVSGQKTSLLGEATAGHLSSVSTSPPDVAVTSSAVKTSLLGSDAGATAKASGTFRTSTLKTTTTVPNGAMGGAGAIGSAGAGVTSKLSGILETLEMAEETKFLDAP